MKLSTPSLKSKDMKAPRTETIIHDVTLKFVWFSFKSWLQGKELKIVGNDTTVNFTKELENDVNP